jgi:hypothetical protein
MFALLGFFLALFLAPFKSKSRLEAENAALRRQLIVLQRKVRGRVHFTSSDRLFFIQLYRWFPSLLKVITIMRPETIVRWHRAGFRRYWRWKSRSLGGRPQIEADLRALIRRMSIDNPLWGAPRIHGELLKLGFEVAQSSVAKYMVKRHAPPSPGWRTFLRNHAPDIAAMDLFVAPTIGFNLLYGFILVHPWENGHASQNSENEARGRDGTALSAMAPRERPAASYNPAHQRTQHQFFRPMYNHGARQGIARCFGEPSRRKHHGSYRKDR